MGLLTTSEAINMSALLRPGTNIQIPWVNIPKLLEGPTRVLDVVQAEFRHLRWSCCCWEQDFARQLRESRAEKQGAQSVDSTPRVADTRLGCEML